MRTYTPMPAGQAAKLLVTTGGTTRTVATVPDPQVATDLSGALTELAARLLGDAARPDLPAALRTLGVRRREVEPEPGHLRLSVLADRPGPDFAAGTAWRSTGIETVWYLAHVLHHLDRLPQGPARSIRRELADLLGLADGPVVTATITADGYDASAATLMITSWLATATDEELDGLIDDEYGPGYGTDQVAYAFEALVAPLMAHGFSVRLDPDTTRAWLQAHRPHLLAG